jgi:hypothetical protein
MKRLIYFPVVIAFVLMISSCAKELDLDSGEYFSVKEFLQSKNAKADCDEKADCEGKNVRLEGLIDGDRVIRETNNFYIKDKDNPNFDIEIRVEESISNPVFDLLEPVGDRGVKVMGIADGYDKPTNYRCERVIFLVLLDPADLEIVE